MAVLIIMAMLKESDVERLLLAAGWNIDPPENHSAGYDFDMHRKGHAYRVEIKLASEGRGDRLIPLMSQAILQLQRAAVDGPRLLAIVGSARIPIRVAERILEFASDHAPNVNAGVIDGRGLRLFRGPGLEDLNANPNDEARPRASSPTDLFSDLNQWMLKVLLARHLPEPDLVGCPQARLKNASELAQVAQVSVMSAFRLLDQLKRQGFLDESSSSLRLVRVAELLRKWQAASDRPAKELAVRWAIPGDPANRLRHALKGGGEFCCLGLFAAARDLGYGHVHGAPLHILVHDFNPAIARRMGVLPSEPGEKPDLYLRLPRERESAFRGIVQRTYKSCDIFQAWLDVSHHPARGAEQADHIYRKVMEPMLLRAKHGD